MADGPAVLVIDKKQGSEHLLGRHLGLRPGGTVVIGVEDMTAIAHSHKALADIGYIQQQPLLRLGRLDGVTGD
ncbi:hypothetical protein D9M68_804500 [compost metagenome]